MHSRPERYRSLSQRPRYDPDWLEWIEIARQARDQARKARGGRPVTFDTRPIPIWLPSERTLTPPRPDFVSLLPTHPFRLTYGPRDDRLRDFYLPALERSVRYRRSAGYFSNSFLAIAAAGVARLVRNGGSMQPCGAA